ncbi:hypothetical protein [Nonomuraea recticatena]|uniref:Uncharacterized protein n=1 Tax=Nonomuraea recticatena TaxID=46178 RepID=A0ABN3SX80_9ACTN
MDAVTHPTVMDRDGETWKADGDVWRAWEPLTEELGEVGQPTPPLIPFSAVPDADTPRRWRTCDMAGYALELVDKGADDSHVRVATLTDDQRARRPQPEPGPEPVEVPATRASAHYLNARQLFDLGHLSGILERCGVDVSGRHGGNRIAAALAHAKASLEDLHDVLALDWSDCMPGPSASLRPYEAVDPE